MKIREIKTIAHSTKADQQVMIIDAIKELDQQYADGTMEKHAYFMKKRSLMKML